MVPGIHNIYCVPLDKLVFVSSTDCTGISLVAWDGRVDTYWIYWYVDLQASLISWTTLLGVAQ